MPAERRKRTKLNPTVSNQKNTSNSPKSIQKSVAPFNRRTSSPWLIFSLAIIGAGLLATYYYWYGRHIPRQSVPEKSNGEMFVVVDLPGKGKGIVAARDIAQGELVIREKPLFVVPRQINVSPTALISQLLSNASLAGQEAFLNLSYINFPKHLDPSEHPEEVALAIFQTNAVAAGESVGIFPGMARLNHGCSAAFNVVYTWRQKEGALVIHALKNIRKGEELLTTYLDTKRPRDQRRAYLAERYGFHCTCSVCSLPAEQSRASDARLSAISGAYDRFKLWGERQIGGAEAITIVRRIWKLEDEEGYWSERGQLAADAAWVSASHSDAKATREWAQKALEWYTHELGSDSEQAEEMQKIIAQPESHRAWGSRERWNVGGPEV